ncbi:MAG TPA: Ig-like domain-containing protein [Thermoanaerobaculia bacterium]
MRRNLLGSLFIFTVLTLLSSTPLYAALSCRAQCTGGTCSCWFCSCSCDSNGGAHCGERQAVVTHTTKGTLATIEPFAGAKEGEVDFSTIEIARSAGYGELSYRGDGTFLYFPAGDFVGLDSFTFNACNFYGECDYATVLIDVRAE